MDHRATQGLRCSWGVGERVAGAELFCDRRAQRCWRATLVLRVGKDKGRARSVLGP